MKLVAVLLALVASVASDATLNVDGREFRAFSARVGYFAAKAACEAQGGGLATICSGEELVAFRASGFKARVTTEFWIGLPSSLNHHNYVSVDKLGSMNIGSRCRILSNWGSKPWSVYTKYCNSVRPYICEIGEVRETCPVPTEAPAPVVDPTEAPAPVVDPTEAPAPVVDPTEAPAPVVDPTEAPVVDPTEAPAPVVEPTPVIDPTPAPTVIVDPTEPELCPKEREAFKATGLPVEPQFEEGSCKYLGKQCNDETCFCVNSKNGKRKYGKMEVPLGQDYDCSKKAKKCLQKRFSAVQKQADYIPQCSNAGLFEVKQCDESGTCWCVNKKGKEVKKTRNTDGDAVQC